MKDLDIRRSFIGGGVVAALALSAATGTAGAHAPAAHAASSGTYDVVVGLTSDPFYEKSEQGAQAEAKALGVKVDFTGSTDFDQSAESNVLNTLVASQPAGLVVAPVDPDGIVPTLKQWVSAKIPISTFDSTVDGSSIPIVTRIGSQNYNGGVLAAKALAKSLGGKGDVATLGLNTADVVLSQRQVGFIHELKTAYPNIKVVDSVLSGSSSSSIYQSDAQSLVNKYPDLKAIFCTNDVASEAAAQGVQQLGDAGKVKIAGFDGGQALFTLVKKNVVQVLVQQQPGLEAGGALKYLVMHNKGKKVPKTFDYPDILVTPANVGSMQKYMY